MTNSDAQVLIDAITKTSRSFSDWEKQFIASIKRRIGVGGNVSRLQEKTLIELYCKCYGGDRYENKLIV